MTGEKDNVPDILSCTGCQVYLRLLLIKEWAMVMDWVFLLDTAPQQIHLSPEVLLNVLSL